MRPGVQCNGALYTISLWNSTVRADQQATIDSRGAVPRGAEFHPACSLTRLMAGWKACPTRVVTIAL